MAADPLERFFSPSAATARPAAGGRRRPPAQARLAWGVAACGLACAAALVGAPAAHAARAADRSIIELEVGGSQLIRPATVADRVIVGEPNVCDVQSVGGGALFVTAKQAGETQLNLIARDGSQATYRIVASVPTTALAQALKEAFPEEEDLQARSVGGALYLAGTVSDAVVVEAAGRIAQSLFAGGGRKLGEVINLLQVAVPQQVQVHLRFVEISRTNMRNMGFNLWFNDTEKSGALFGPSAPAHYSLANDSQRFAGPTNPPLAPGGTAIAGQPNANPYLPILMSPVTGSFQLAFAQSQLLSAFPFTATLGLLEQRGVAKTLSEPTLVTTSGKEAKFLVGGEIPFPIPSTLGQVTIQFKPYGASLTFTPTVLSQETVSLDIDSMVSDIDRANGVTTNSINVPALTSRQSHTTVRLRDGQSFAIAGLLSDKLTTTQQNVPGLGDIPLIGLFFRNIQRQRQEAELMVMVTANLVKPVEANQLPPLLNRDEFSEPGSLELFIMGYWERAAQRRDARAQQATRRGAAHAMNEPDGLIGFSH